MTKNKNKSFKSAFTLIEMLVVMGLMIIMLTVGISSFYGIGESSSLSGVMNELQATMVHSRQQAIIQKYPVNVYFHHDDTKGDTVYEAWAITNGSTSVSYSDLEKEKEAEADDRKDFEKDQSDVNSGFSSTYDGNEKEYDRHINNIGYMAAAIYRIPRNIAISVDGTIIKGSVTKSITFTPTGSSSLSSGDTEIKIGFDRDDNDTIDSGGYIITIYSLTGLTQVENDF